MELSEKSKFLVLLGFYLSFDQTSKKYNKKVVSSGAIYIFDLAENDQKEIVRCNMDRKILATTVTVNKKREWVGARHANTRQSAA